MGPDLSWATRLRNRNELSGQLSVKHAFNMTWRRTVNQTLIDMDGIDRRLRPPCHVASLSQSHLVSFHLLTLGYFHNSKYSQPWLNIHLYLVGDRKSPDFYRLSNAKHLYSILDLHRIQGIYISGQGRYMHQVFSFNSYNLMHQTYITQFDIYKNIGGLECFGACLGSNTRSVFVKWHSLGKYLPSWHLLSPPVFWIDL
jgi:hypothetical protein